MKFTGQGEILICGDLNAWTGGLHDFIPHNEINENIKECPLPGNYISDIPTPRHQIDKISNLHGNLLTNLCKDMQLKILNGRFLGDS